MFPCYVSSILLWNPCNPRVILWQSCLIPALCGINPREPGDCLGLILGIDPGFREKWDRWDWLGLASGIDPTSRLGLGWDCSGSEGLLRSASAADCMSPVLNISCATSPDAKAGADKQASLSRFSLASLGLSAIARPLALARAIALAKPDIANEH